jgi:hypothetical protein
LPYHEDDPLLRMWIESHPIHLTRALYSESFEEDLPRDVFAFLKSRGVVRGVATGDRAMLVDTAGGLLQQTSGTLPQGVPGVVRTRFVRRDGGGLLGTEMDPRLVLTGLRLAGGEEFVKLVRER